MKINYQTPNLNADKKLLEFIEEKLNKLDTFYNRIIDADVFLKMENSSDKDNKKVEIKLNVNNISLFSEHVNDSFEAAAVNSIESIRIQLKKHKAKHTSH